MAENPTTLSAGFVPIGAAVEQLAVLIVRTAQARANIFYKHDSAPWLDESRAACERILDALELDERVRAAIDGMLAIQTVRDELSGA